MPDRLGSVMLSTMDSSQATDKITVFLLDDHEVVRRGLRDLLEASGMEIVGEASTVAEAIGRIPACRPQVAVLDVRLPDGDGIEVCRDVRSDHPEIRCLMLTSFSDDEALMGAIMAGASGYVLKQVRGHDLADAIRRVARGEYGVVREELPCRAAGLWGLSNGKRPEAIAWWFSAERL